MSVLAVRVKKLRNSKKQSQNDVGKAMGKSREAVSKYEIGKREPDPEAIVLLAKHFNVSADYILGITDDFETLGDKRNLFSSELYAFEKYLKDEKFIPYLQLAVSIKDANINIKQLETYIHSLKKQAKK